MFEHQVFAIITNEKIENIMVCDNYELANQIARDVYGQEAFAVDCRQYPCGIGDGYFDGAFYHRDSNAVIERLPNEKEEIETLKAENLRLQENITNLELALAEIYEGGI